MRKHLRPLESNHYILFCGLFLVKALQPCSLNHKLIYWTTIIAHDSLKDLFVNSSSFSGNVAMV